MGEGSTSAPTSITPPPKPGYVGHAPIRINSNAEFASMAAAEGWNGSGIEADP